ITSPSTASPRNSSRSLVGNPPFSYAYDRCVSARSSNPGSKVTPSAPSSEEGSGVVRGPPLTLTSRLAGSDGDDLLVVIGPARLAHRVRQLRLPAGAVLAGDQRRCRGLP